MKENLQRTLGLNTSVAVVVGGIIGSAIFMKPALMASQLGSPILLLGIWLFAGVITMFGAMSNAEVAALIPETGGQYVFFQKMYGDFVAFLYAWSAFAVFNTAGVASIAYVLGTYTEFFIDLPRFSPSVEASLVLHIPFIGSIFPLQNIGVKLVTVLVVLGLTWISYRSTRSSGNFQVIFTALKIGAMIILVFGILFSGKGSVSNFFTSSTTIHPTGWALISALIAATSGAFWGYDGWNNITFIAGEIKDPQRNIPKSLFLGLLCCIVTYMLITMSYLYILPVDEMAKATMVATDTTARVMGAWGAGIIAIMVIISTLGATNGNILATARVSFALAQHHPALRWIGDVHPKFKTPGNALWLHGLWTSALVFTGSFDMLTDMLIFVSWIFYGLSALGIFILRRKMPNADRPYRVWGYPIIPAIFLIFTVLFLVITLANEINSYRLGITPLVNSAFGLTLTGLGVPIYLYLRWKKSKA